MSERVTVADLQEWAEASRSLGRPDDAEALRRTADTLEALQEALSSLVSAARGMPISYDNLCQSTLDHAIEAAEEALHQEPGEGGGGEPDCDKPHRYIPCDDADVCFACSLPRSDPIHDPNRPAQPEQAQEGECPQQGYCFECKRVVPEDVACAHPQCPVHHGTGRQEGDG